VISRGPGLPLPAPAPELPGSRESRAAPGESRAGRATHPAPEPARAPCPRGRGPARRTRSQVLPGSGAGRAERKFPRDFLLMSPAGKRACGHFGRGSVCGVEASRARRAFAGGGRTLAVSWYRQGGGFRKWSQGELRNGVLTVHVKQPAVVSSKIKVPALNKPVFPEKRRLCRHRPGTAALPRRVGAAAGEGPARRGGQPRCPIRLGGSVGSPRSRERGLLAAQTAGTDAPQRHGRPIPVPGPRRRAPMPRGAAGGQSPIPFRPRGRPPVRERPFLPPRNLAAATGRTSRRASGRVPEV
jgi:hypothetical protein